MITNWMLVAVNALIIAGTIAYAEQDPNYYYGDDGDYYNEDPDEGQIISKRIFSNTYSHIWPPLVAIFLALRVWEGTGAIQDDKYLKR
jgi:hypothetical protein